MPRPPVVLTDEEKNQVEKLSAVLSTEQLADYLGIGRTTFYDIMERDASVAEHYKRGKARAIGNVAKGLVSQAMEGNTTAAIFYLKTQAGWKETTVVDNTSSDGSMSPKDLDREQLDQELKDLGIDG